MTAPTAPLGSALRSLVRRRPRPRIAEPLDLTVENLVVAHGQVEALHGMSLRVGAGEAVAILGANGAGKTSLLRTVSGLNRPREGRITFGGVDITGERPDRILRLGIAHVPEGRQILVRQTVLENLQLGRLVRHGDKDEVERDLASLLEVFPALGNKLRQPAGHLSGGQLQMLAIARGLMAAPRLLLLDEPSLGLAPLLMDEITVLIQRIRAERGIGVLLVDQNAFMAAQITERTYLLRRGHVAAEVPSADVTGNPEVIGAYLGLASSGPETDRKEM